MAEEDVLDKLNDVLNAVVANLEKINEIKVAIEKPKSVQIVCHHCGGDGQKATSGGDLLCPDCGGDGILVFARITNTSDE